MATLKPFRALRALPEKAAQICCPPYDVMNTEEARAMAQGNPLSFLHVTRAEIDFGPEVDSHSDEVYQRAAQNLRNMLAEGHLVRDEKPCYYLYRLTMGSHRQLGIVAAASCEEYERGIVKKHELTRPDKEDDRTRHINLLGAQTGPVFLTFRTTAEINALMTAESQRPPDVDFTADDKVRHEAWVVSDPTAVEKFEAAFARVPALYVADGHHRSAAALRVAKERAAANPLHNGNESYNFFLSVSFPDDQVQILGYNRVVKDLNGLSIKDVLVQLSKVAEIGEAPPDHLPSGKGEVTMLLGGEWRLLRWKNGVVPQDDPVESLDVSVLQKRVLEPIFAIGNPRTDTRIAFVGGIRGTAELERLVNRDKWGVAFALHPTSVEELMAIADADGLMPPKSTWFEPKLRDAMMIHVID